MPGSAHMLDVVRLTPSTTYSFYAGREAGIGHRVRLRARLPDGTWGAFSTERTVTTGEPRRPLGAWAVRRNPSPARGRSGCGAGPGPVGCL
ncbi:hypothetical protein [Streptomyces sp. NPDC050121]|uniref:hypothetical protein n=1 Tax=Streptomyces sp. NPDC050121 TaxID=3365601 RepID=UPI003799D9E5